MKKILALVFCSLFPLSSSSMAVEGLDLEKIGIEANLVPKEAEFFVEQHIQNPPKSTSGKIFYVQLKLYLKKTTF